MRIRFIKPHRSRATQEVSVLPGTILDVPAKYAVPVLREGAAVIHDDAPPQLPETPYAPYQPLPQTPEQHRVVAAMTTYNDADCIEWVVRRALAQGIELVIIDNWSDDGTWDIVQSIDDPRILAMHRFPDKPRKTFDFDHLRPYLLQVLHDTAPRAWHMWHASDEVITSPWHNVPYRDALWLVQCVGYNAINHHYLDFHPTTHHQLEPGGDVANALHFYETRQLPVIRTWYAPDVQSVELHDVGHDVYFEGKRVYPEPFILRNYRYRSEEHAARKLAERKSRLARSLKRIGHTPSYYADDARSFVKREEELVLFNPADWYGTCQLLSKAHKATTKDTTHENPPPAS